MDFLAFDKGMDALIEEMREMRKTKGKEYTEGSRDRFANFNALAAQLKLDRKKVWQVYFAKHLSSIYSYIDQGREFSDEVVHKRIVDAMTYLALLDGMIMEEKSIAELEAIPGGEMPPKVVEHRPTWAHYPNAGLPKSQCNWGTTGGWCRLRAGHEGDHIA